MRLVGPNCLGVTAPAIGLDATFAARHPQTELAASTDFPPGEKGVRHARTQAAGQRPALAAAVGHEQSIVSHQQRLLCAGQHRSAPS